jgi:uncharacterized membrane protein
MNKKEFLSKLDENLKFLSRKEREEVIKDYEEHFANALSAGKKEADIVKSLGNPKVIASSYKFEAEAAKTGNKINVANIINGIYVAFGLGFFNLVFVFGIYMGTIGIFIGLMSIPLVFSFVGALVMFISILPTLPSWMVTPMVFALESLNLLSRLSLALIGVGFVSLSVVLFILFYQLGKLIYFGTINYIKSNISLIRKAAGINE